MPCSTANYGIFMLLASHAAVAMASLFFVVLIELRGWDASEFFSGLKSRDHLILWLETLSGMVPAYLFMGYLLRQRCREIVTIFKTLKNFSVRGCDCFDPSDRIVVEKRIVDLWGSLDAFDEFVRGPLAEEMNKSISSADLAPLWLDIVLGLPWGAIFSVAGLLQDTGPDTIGFVQVLVVSLGFGGVLCPFALMFWYFIAFKVFLLLDNSHPKLCVVGIGTWTLFNCLFSAAIYYAVMMSLMTQPILIATPTIGIFLFLLQYGTYYFRYVEKREYWGQMTWPLKLCFALILIPTVIAFNYRGATIGCEHWTCIFPHPPAQS